MGLQKNGLTANVGTSVANQKILMITGDLTEDYETMVPFQALSAMGFSVDAVSPDKVAGETITTWVNDIEGEISFTKKHGHDFTLNATFDDILKEHYDALIIPGGKAPELLRKNQRVINLVKYFFTKNKPVAAISQGLLLLCEANVLKGKRCSAFPACKKDATLAGGELMKAPIDQAITDGNLITAASWQANSSLLLQMVIHLNR